MYVKNNNNFVSQHILGYLHFFGEGAIISPSQYNFQPRTSHNFSIIMVFSHIHSLYKQTCKHNWRKLRANFPHIILHFFWEKLILKVFNIGYLCAVVFRCFPKKADSEFYVIFSSDVVGPSRRRFLLHVVLCLASVIFIQMGRLTQHHTQLPGNRSTPILLLSLCLFTFLNRPITVVFPPIVL